MSASEASTAPIGVLWTNLGTPDAPRPRDVRRYLRQFLTDRRVVDLNPILWRVLLELVILPRRGHASAEAYESVWTSAGSPLLANARAQSVELQKDLGADYRVAVAMRYGNPSIASAIEELVSAGCERIVLLSAFPQYASATTGSAIEETFRVLSRRRAIPALAVAPPYPTEPGYLDALAATARRAALGREIAHWIFSFHGIPVRCARAGDPYPTQCTATARGLAARLGLGDADWSLTWQSRFGREPWLEPATDVAAVARARAGGTLALIAPGFTADCLETLEELGIRLRDDVREAGADLLLVPCLNADPGFVKTLASLVRAAAG